MEVAQLYTELHRELTAWAIRLTRDKTRAEDLVQETFLRALTHWDELGAMQKGACRAWLYKTARNLYIDQTRKRSREEAEAEGFEDLASFEEDLSRAAAAQLVGRLPESERTLFILRSFEGYNASELGEMFSLPPATVRSRLASARRRLRGWLKESL